MFLPAGQEFQELSALNPPAAADVEPLLAVAQALHQGIEQDVARPRLPCHQPAGRRTGGQIGHLRDAA